MGNFCNLGEVGIGKGTACNILSTCQMLDTGRTFKYDDKNDEFVIPGLNESDVFARRLRLLFLTSGNRYGIQYSTGPPSQ